MPIQIEGSAPTREVVQPPITEFKSIKPLDSQKSRQVEALFSNMKDVFDYLNSTRGVWRGTEEEATKLDMLNASAKSLNDPKLEEVILRFRNEIHRNPVFATGIAAGMQHPYMKDIQDFFRENGYVFIVTQFSGERGRGEQTSFNQAEETRGEFGLRYLFGKIDESKVRGYGDMGVKVDFLKDVQSSTPYMAGYSSTFTNSSIVVVRSNVHECILMIDKLEKKLNGMDEQEKRLVEGFDKLGRAEFEEYAKNKSPENTLATLAEIVHMKIIQDYMKGGSEHKGMMLQKVINDTEGMYEAHELGEKIVSIKRYGERSFQTDTIQIGERRIYLIIGSPLTNVSAESKFNPSEREMVSDLVSLVEKPRITIMETMERYTKLLKQASTEEIIMVNTFKRYYEASKELVDGVVKFVEENREKFPEVKKSGILVLGELTDKQISEISKALLEKKYMEKGYAFDYSLVF
jgi:hypothetical protein